MKTLNTLVKKNILYMMLHNKIAFKYYINELSVKEFEDFKELINSLRYYYQAFKSVNGDCELPDLSKIYAFTNESEKIKAVNDYIEICNSIDIKKFNDSLFIDCATLKSSEMCKYLGGLIDQCVAAYGDCTLENWNEFLKEKI